MQNGVSVLNQLDMCPRYKKAPTHWTPSPTPTVVATETAEEFKSLI